MIIEENDDKRDNSAELQELHYFGVLTQKPVAFVCHLAAALIKVKAENDYPLVKEKRIIGFSNTEEERTD